VKYANGQNVRLHGPITLQGPLGQVSLEAEESVPGRIAMAYTNNTYDVQTAEPLAGINYFPAVKEKQISPAQ
jgi:hypothetical protein